MNQPMQRPQGGLGGPMPVGDFNKIKHPINRPEGGLGGPMPVGDFNKTKHPINRPEGGLGGPKKSSEFNQQKHPIDRSGSGFGATNKTGVYTKMHDPASMHTRYNHPDQYKPKEDTRVNPSGARLKFHAEREREERGPGGILRSADVLAGQIPVTRAEFQALLLNHLPPELLSMTWNNGGGATAPGPGSILSISENGIPKWQSRYNTFSGKVWIDGRNLGSTYNSTPSKPYIKIDFSGASPSITEEDGPPPSPWARNTVWREKASISGILYIERW